MSFVISVMNAWISEPVASVPMNESTPMITTTKRVDHADEQGDAEA